MKKRRENSESGMGGYMTVEAALIMCLVMMVYVFIIDCMITQYSRCVEELESAQKMVLHMEEEESLYNIKQINPVNWLRLKRLF